MSILYYFLLYLSIKLNINNAIYIIGGGISIYINQKLNS